MIILWVYPVVECINRFRVEIWGEGNGIPVTAHVSEQLENEMAEGVQVIVVKIEREISYRDQLLNILCIIVDKGSFAKDQKDVIEKYFPQIGP